MRPSRPGWHSISMLAATLVLTGCAGQSTEAASTSAPGTGPTPVSRADPSTLSTRPGFDGWVEGFRIKALASGISPATYDAAFAGVRPNNSVIEADGRQPEFTRAIWDYLDSAVSSSRVSTGRDRAAAKRADLERIEATYGVDYPYIVAIWGLESAYGSNFGSIPVIESLATLAYESRRESFGEEQLLAALRILQAGDITPGRMVGSWAGAMGHTQFIPTSFLSYAVDFTGDGKRDIWAPDALDALASTGNYLAKFGWTRGAPALVEVRLPDGFDYALADDDTRRPAAGWEALGVRAAAGGGLPAADSVTILLPAGAAGPAFAAYPNFRVIKRYNNATSYAMAVTLLAERIAGGGPRSFDWPRDDRMLSRTEKQELQEKLTALGYDTGGVDGIIGPNSRAAVRRFQQARGMTPDGYVSAALLTAVRQAGG